MAIILKESEVANIGGTTTSDPNRLYTKSRAEALWCAVTAPSGAANNQLITGVKNLYNGHAFVDMGFPSGTKWATMNVGATVPEGYGNYYKWGLGSSTFNTSQTPYSLASGDLPDSVDTARQVWGGQWHMPTQNQIKELYLNTTKTYTTLNGVYVVKFTSKNNSNYIYVPFAGHYWSNGTFHNSTYLALFWSKTSDSSSNAHCIQSTRLNSTTSTWSEDKNYGLSVRGVVG